ncbi:SLC13 family permease [Longitalea luteola]|uniref:SLC13 family permease n=1 Tax=Longitalea luteola TaxID=2812563 RepID=UPI001A95E787|nr:DASS family sodium-coupled anion symporter [Longitalea luteola]
MKPISKNVRNQLALGAGLILSLVFFLANPFHFDDKAARVLAVAVLMITWWVSEALPMPVVALIPLVLFPLMNIMPIKEVSAGYADSNIFLFMGGFMIGLAIEKWNLHKRIALTIVNITGTSGNRIVLGFILATGLLSMWLSNTATTMMMYPIAASVISVIKDNHKGNARLDNLAICIMLAIAYSSNFGGIATIVGTPPNVAFVSFIKEKYNYTVQFADWMLICAPLSLLLLFSLYFVMTKWLYPSRLGGDGATRDLIKHELQQLGPLTTSEKRVLIVFVSTALLWITKDLINELKIVKLDDTMIAMAGALALFMCPAGENNKEGGRRKILDWADTSKMAWGILLLFGGGIALAGALEKAGLIKQLGQWIAGFSGSGGLMLVFIIALVSLFISEVMSNIAQVIVFSPVIGGIADAMHINPILLGLPMCLGASCASMMPMGTPPNAIVFASGHIKFNQMVKAGFVMNVIAVIVITLFCWYLVPVLMGL